MTDDISKEDISGHEVKPKLSMNRNDAAVTASLGGAIAEASKVRTWIESERIRLEVRAAQRPADEQQLEKGHGR